MTDKEIFEEMDDNDYFPIQKVDGLNRKERRRIKAMYKNLKRKKL